jgi:prepilin-type N-terminal cleavage/methylation domain-containing protein
MHKRAFTLIELLVVIAIISLLSVGVITNMNESRLAAQDARRIAEIKQIEKALALYYQKHGAYPSHTSGWGVDTWHGNDKTTITDFENDLAPFIDLDLSKQLWGPYFVYGEDSIFQYTSPPADGNQQYAIRTRLLSDYGANMSASDNGIFSGMYEVGPLVQYCRENYSGSDADIWHEGTSVCEGGN